MGCDQCAIDLDRSGSTTRPLHRPFRSVKIQPLNPKVNVANRAGLTVLVRPTMRSPRWHSAQSAQPKCIPARLVGTVDARRPRMRQGSVGQAAHARTAHSRAPAVPLRIPVSNAERRKAHSHPNSSIIERRTPTIRSTRQVGWGPPEGRWQLTKLNRDAEECVRQVHRRKQRRSRPWTPEPKPRGEDARASSESGRGPGYRAPSPRP